MDEIQEILSEFGNEIKKKYQIELDNKNINYTGKLRNTIEVEITANDAIYSVFLKFADEYGIVETGRKAKFAPIAPLTAWVEKKIPVAKRTVPTTGKIIPSKSLAFAISKSMAKNGIKGRHILGGVLDASTDVVNKYVNKLNEAIGAKINNEIVKIFEEEIQQ